MRHDGDVCPPHPLHDVPEHELVRVCSATSSMCRDKLERVRVAVRKAAESHASASSGGTGSSKRCHAPCYPRTTISLIEERRDLGHGQQERHIELVRWGHYERREAKRVRLDDLDRIVWNVPADVRTDTFGNIKMIIGTLPQ